MSARSRTVTIMFTDVVGSTALAQRLGEEAAQALRRAQERILRQQFERFGADLVKDTGDGFMVAFDSASQGVECAAAVQRAIAVQHAEGRYPELEVRIGLHTGEPAAEGGDLHGSDVDLAKRIETEAEGGQVLVSDLTRALSRSSAGLEFTPRGERALKGFAEPVPVFEARWCDEVIAGPLLTRFVGRLDESARLRQALNEAMRGQGSLVLVGGEPGVGKTRLASELAIYAGDRGVQVLSGRADETEGMPPYLPFTEPLSQYVRRRSPKELRAQLEGHAPHVAKLLPELRQILPDIPDAPAMSPEGERYALFDGVSDFIFKIAAGTQLLIFLDDLHWADGGTLLLLQHLAQRLSGAPLLVVGTYRDVEIDPQHPLSGLLAEMTRQRFGSSITLRPFDRGETETLIEAVLGETGASRAVDAIFAAAAGNPFFTEELVRDLVEQGRDLANPQAPVGDWEIPVGARQVIQKRLARLGEAAGQLLAYSSVLGRDLSLSNVALLTGKDEDAALDLLDEALAARVLRTESDGYAFAHPLIRETLYQALSIPRRRQLHRRVCESLEALYAADPEPHLAELGYHFFEAARGGDPSPQAVQKAIDYMRRAGDRAVSLYVYADAVEHYRRALEALELTKTPDERTRCELLLAGGRAQHGAGDWEGARENFWRAADIARRAHAGDLLAEAAVAVGLGEMSALGVVDERLIALLEESMRALGETDSAVKVKVLALLGIRQHWSRLEQARGFTQDAVDMARRLGDDDALASALNARHDVAWEDTEERLELAKEALRLAESAGDKYEAVACRLRLLSDLLELGEIEAVDAEIAALSQLADELRQPFHQWIVGLARATRVLLDGHLEEGERLAQQAFALGQRWGSAQVTRAFASQIFYVRMDQGRLHEMESIAKSIGEQMATINFVRAAFAFLYSESDRVEEARAEFQVIAAKDFTDLPRDEFWSLTMFLLSRVCARLADERSAATLYDLFLPFAGRNVVLGRNICTGSASLGLALLATTLRRWADAQRHFEDALKMNNRIGARGWVAWTQYDYAKMLLARGEPGDSGKADPLLRRALDTARELGMKALEVRAVALMESRPGLAPKYPDGLTNPPVASNSDLTDGNR